MAKKIRIDFSKTEERSGWNTRQIPPGLYKATIASVKETEAQDGTAMLVYGFRPTSSRFRTRLFPYYCKLQQNQLWKLRDLLIAAGERIPKKALNIDPNKVVGREIAIEVEDDVWDGKVRSQVQAVFSAEMAEEDLAAEDSDETQDEVEDDNFDEVEDDFDEDEDFDEDLEDDELDEDDLDAEDDFDEDLDDEDDLEDEDLADDFDDEEFDDEDDEEEEEPEPKPVKRSKKPARKSPAKKRVVRKRK